MELLKVMVVERDSWEAYQERLRPMERVESTVLAQCGVKSLMWEGYPVISYKETDQEIMNRFIKENLERDNENR